MTPDLQVDVLDTELIRVSMKRGPIEVACFVTSHHLVEDKRRQLQAHIERIEAEQWVRMTSLLDRCAGGSILDKVQPLEPKPDPSASAALRQRILADCLPAQREFLNDTDHRIIGYIGGFGSGKSWALAAKIVFLGLANSTPDADGVRAHIPHDSHGANPCARHGAGAMGHPVHLPR